MEKTIIAGHPLDDDGYRMYEKLKPLTKEKNCECIFCEKIIKEHTVQ